MKLIGIRRDPRYSPRSVERDAAILEAVALRLTEVAAFQVDLVSESEFGEECLPQVDGVFTMARSPRVLSVLAAAESRGVPVGNSARGVQGLSRRGVNDMGRKLGVSVPPSVAVSGNGGVPVGHMAYPCWLKRDDACAQQSDDIHFVTNDAEWRVAVEDFTRRGIREYVAEKHLKGDVLKFYGVAGTGFFFCYYPTDEHGFSKFGLEHINGAAKGFLFDRAELKRQADRLGSALSVPIYGGDAIVGAGGLCSIIDFNDWPSYSACRDGAATAIAGLIRARYAL